MATKVKTLLSGGHKRLLFVSLLFILAVFVSLCIYTLTVDIGNSSLEGAVHVRSETELRAAINKTTPNVPVVIALDRDIKLTEGPLFIGVNQDITLTSNKANGFYKLIGAKEETHDIGLSMTFRYSTIIVGYGGVLRLDGIIITHAKGIPGEGVAVDRGGTLILYDGKISDNNNPRAYMGHAHYVGNGGGVSIYFDGFFEMYGGEISGNTAYCGGGVHTWGNFTMYDGIISDNNADYSGGGVYGTVDRVGGEIYNNTENNNPYPENNLGTSENNEPIFITVICVGAMIIMGIVMVLISYFRLRKNENNFVPSGA